MTYTQWFLRSGLPALGRILFIPKEDAMKIFVKATVVTLYVIALKMLLDILQEFSIGYITWGRWEYNHLAAAIFSVVIGYLALRTAQHLQKYEGNNLGNRN